MLLRRRHEILRFNITELLLSAMTELSNLLVGKKLLKYRVFHAVFPTIAHFHHQLEKNFGGANFYCRPHRVWNGEGFCPCRPPLDPLVGGSMPAWLLVIINNRSPNDTVVLFFLQHASSAS